MTRATRERTPPPPPPPPEHLSERSKALWARIVSERRVRSVGRPVLLQTALEALDRAEAARQAVEKEGMTKTTPATGAVHIHPLLKVERESRQLFARLWEQLGLTWDCLIDGRDRDRDP
jgi:P27 family predicted phage terminase small subunit